MDIMVTIVESCRCYTKLQVKEGKRVEYHMVPTVELNKWINYFSNRRRQYE